MVGRVGLKLTIQYRQLLLPPTSAATYNFFASVDWLSIC